MAHARTRLLANSFVIRRGVLLSGALACISHATIFASFQGWNANVAHAQEVGGMAQANPESQARGYKLPPDAMRRVLDTKPTPSVSMSPDGKWLVLMERISLPPVADLAAPMVKLAGSRVNPNTNGPHGPRRITGFTIRNVQDGSERKVELPIDANLSGPGWMPAGDAGATDGESRFIFSMTTDRGKEAEKANGIELWVCDVERATARSLTKLDPKAEEIAQGMKPTALNAATGASARWMPNRVEVMIRRVPDGRGKMPERPRTPTGPIMQETRGEAAPVRTYQDMLTDAYDADVFDWIMPSQLTLINVETGARRDVGVPAIFADATPSPDGKFVLVSRVVPPYSYQVPWSLFPEVVEVWDVATGAVVKEIAKVELRETIPTQGVETGPRGFEWADAMDAMLVWAEALDGGDPRAKVPHRDRVMTLGSPFTGEARELLKVEHRFRGLSWLETENDEMKGGSENVLQAMLGEFDRDRRRTKTWLIEVADEAGGAASSAGGTVLAREPRLLFDRSVNDLYSDPGQPLADVAPNGSVLIKVRDGHVFLRGEGASKEGNRPFLDVMSLGEGFAKQRLWQNTGEEYERVVDLLENEVDSERARAGSKAGYRLVTSHETKMSPPNMRVREGGARTLTDAAGEPVFQSFAGEARAITAFTDPLPELRQIQKRVLTYSREDGVPLSATLYTPPGYVEGTRLPLFVWAYPNEVSDAATAGQLSDSPYRFTQIGGSSHLFVLLAGYAVMDDASMPVVGDPETVNDTFVTQIVSSAKAAIDIAAELGVADSTRVAIGGHSYGAFMTANLLAHAPKGMFKAGIARSGAYNRTLTPFGFQSERRSFWEAQDVYMKLSPFTYADKIKTPLLLTHGQIDNNPGTFPIQSERLFQAINGTGGTARLVVLPYEGHGYAARESVQHVLAEMVEWMDTYVKPVEDGASDGLSEGARSGLAEEVVR